MEKEFEYEEVIQWETKLAFLHWLYVANAVHYLTMLKPLQNKRIAESQ